MELTMNDKRIEKALWVIAFLLLLNLLTSIKPYQIVAASSGDEISGVLGYRVNVYSGGLVVFGPKGYRLLQEIAVSQNQHP